jgi:Flp pilus assembly protein TadG
MAAIMLPILIGAVGMSIDLANAYLVRERLSRALDAAALAAAGSGSDDLEEVRARVESFLNANYPAEKIGAVVDFDVEINGDDISVSAEARYSTAFMWVLGINKLDVDAGTTVNKQVKGVEAVLVLDNTGSMDFKPVGETKKNIEALKTAATDFVTIMFDKAQDPNDVRIGIVPYANSVRIGLYGVGQVPNPSTGVALTGEAGVYNDGEAFVTLPSGMTYTTNHDTSTKNRWYGCVVEHQDDGYNSSAVTTNNTSTTGNRGQIWTVGGTDYAGHGWNPGISNNDPYPNDVEDEYEGPWDIYNYGTISSTCTQSHNVCTQYRCDQWRCDRYRSDGTCRTYSSTVCQVRSTTVCQTTASVCDQYTYNFNSSSTPNSGCPYANVLPLTSDESALKNNIGSMQAHGNTQGNAGMIWGYRMVSPEPPFTEASPWGSEYWKKAIILMTDGDNTMDGTYSYLWASAKNDIGVNTSNGVKGLNARLSEVCEALDDEDVLVYTIVFRSETEVNQATKDLYKECATEDSMYFYAPTQTALHDTFEHIARELSNLRISD